MSAETISTGEKTIFGSITGDYSSSNRLDLRQKEIIDDMSEAFEKDLAQARNSADVRYLKEFAFKLDAYKQFQAFLNSDDNLAEFVYKASNHVAAKGHAVNIYSTYYNDLINKAIAKHGEQSITLPDSICSYKLKDILTNPDLREHFNLQEVKDLLKGVIEDEFSSNSDFMIHGEELQKELSKESAFAGLGFSDGLTGPGFRTGLVAYTPYAVAAVAKRHGWDRFTGKLSLEKKMLENIDDLAFESYVKSTGNKLEDLTENGKKYAKATYNKHKTLTNNIDDIAEALATKHAGALKNEARIAKAAKSAAQLRSAQYAHRAAKIATKAKNVKNLAKAGAWIKRGWTAISLGLKTAGIAGGPVGLLASFGLGLALDLVVGELIDTAVTIASGEEPKFNEGESFSFFNPMSWTIIPGSKLRFSNLGEGLAVVLRGGTGFVKDGFQSTGSFVVDGPEGGVA
jgi:hypothetical protein